MDLALFGATGFTGALTAEYLAKRLPAGARLGLAGRDLGKLAALRDRLGVDAEVVQADVTDPKSLAALAESTRVVISTVGPYLRHGEPMVAACAATGADYLDLTGEPEFVDRMFLTYHETAVRSGARLVHACGFDSIPADLGAFFTVQQLPADQPIRLRGYLTTSGRPSGGTFESALLAMTRLREASAVHRQRRAAEGAPPDRRVRVDAGRPGYDRSVGAWVLPMPVIDPQIVVRSARALPRYGPDFSYGHFAALPNPFVAAGLLVGVGGMVALAQVPMTRRALLRLRPAGSGPSEERRAKSWFRVRFVAESAGQRVSTQVSGGDPGYGETSKMLAESALCLAFDELPSTAGQVTTAAAMGDALLTRLQAAGIRFTLD